MKKSLLLFMVLLLSVSLCLFSCNGKDNDGDTNQSENNKPEEKKEEEEFSFDTMETWLREQSCLNANVKIILEDLRGSEKKEREFHSVDGLKGFATYLDKSKELLNKEPIQMIKQQDDTYIEIVLQWTTAYTETSLCFTNNIPNRDGGTHLAGFRAGLTRAINKYIAEKGTKKDINLSGEDFRVTFL